ncbi:MAG: TonB-dependent receptor [Planctomycetes bacterium]|nr:TonB-dependent receptor [Planctomycetota bacterium]
MVFSMANKKNELAICVTEVLAMAFYAGFARAQESVPVSAEEITVTAARVEEPVSQVPQSVETVSSEEIARHQPRTMADAMKYELGIWLPRAGGHAAGGPIVRGFTGTQMLLMVDGVRLNNSQLKIGPNKLFNQMNIDAVERIEILKGPGAVQYGSDAIGGVINVITKNSLFFPEQPQYDAAFKGRYGSVDGEQRESADVSYANRLLNFNVGVSFADIGDVKGGGDLGTLKPSSWNEEHFFAKANVRFSKTKKLGISYLNTFRQDIMTYSQSRVNQSGIPKTFRPEEAHTIFKASFEAGAVARWADNMKIYISNQTFDNVVETTTENSSKITEIIRDRDENMLGLGVQMTSPLSGEMRLIYGADYRYDNIKETKVQYVTTKSTGAVKLTPSTDGQTPDGTYDVISAFNMFEWQMFNRAKLFAGLRFESAHLDSKPAPEDLASGFSLEDVNLNKRWSAITESAGMIIPAGTGTDITVNIGTGFRSPNYADVLRFGVTNTKVFVPAPDVEPEHSLSYELGLRRYNETWTGNISVFYNSLKDIIVEEATGGYLDIDGDGQNDSGEAVYTKNNVGSAYMYGIEAKYDARLNEHFTLFGNTAWVLGKDTESDIPLGYVPPANGLLGVRWQKKASDSLWMELSLKAVSAQTRETPDDRADAGRAMDPALKYPSADNPPLRSDYSIPGYAVLNMYVGGSVLKNMTVTTGIENIFDREYREVFSDIDSPGRNIFLSVEIKF